MLCFCQCPILCRFCEMHFSGVQNCVLIFTGLFKYNWDRDVSIFLNPNVVTFLNQNCKDLDIDDKEFMKKFHFNEFLKWLKDDDFIDYDEENDQFAIPFDIINVQ